MKSEEDDSPQKPTENVVSVLQKIPKLDDLFSERISEPQCSGRIRVAIPSNMSEKNFVKRATIIQTNISRQLRKLFEDSWCIISEKCTDFFVQAHWKFGWWSIWCRLRIWGTRIPPVFIDVHGMGQLTLSEKNVKCYGFYRVWMEITCL